MITLLDIVIVAVVLGFAYRGWLAGVLTASVAALELVACLAVAVTLHESLAGFLHEGVSLLLGDGVSSTWSILLAFAVPAWGLFAAIRWVFHRRPETDDDEPEIDPLGDRVAGAVAGAVGGAMVVGGVLITASMVPWLSGLTPSGDRLLLDVGKTALRVASEFAIDRQDGRLLPLDGEPPSRQSDLAARLTSEPWFDVDDDGKYTEADRFRDVDGNGTFTKDLYFIDVDGDGVRRVGLVDKYVVGRWDGGLISDDRPRPDEKKPAPHSGPSADRPGGKPEPKQPEPKKPEPKKPEPKKPEPKKPEPVVPPPDQPAGKRPDDDF
jgi:hypothetical protein